MIRHRNDSPLGLAVDLVFGRGDGIPREIHTGMVTNLQDVVVGGPLYKSVGDSSDEPFSQPTQ
jgi:hypothetical protein